MLTISAARALLSAKPSIILQSFLPPKPRQCTHHPHLYGSPVLVTERWRSRTFHLPRALRKSSDMPGHEPSEEITTGSDPEPGSAGPGGAKFPIWARWVLGSIVCLVVPYFKRALTIEDGVEKVAETATAVVEAVAEATEKVVVDVADAITDSKLKQEIMEVEKFADEVDKDAKKVDEFIHKVDRIKEEIEALIGESFTNAGERTVKETKAKKNTPTSNL